MVRERRFFLVFFFFKFQDLVVDRKIKGSA